MKPKHICILGAGIVGLATAWRLRRDGYRVSVVDRATPGEGASGGNGGQLSYSYVQPLADPSIWAQLPRLLLSPHSPLKLRPTLDPQQWRWGLAFLAACNQPSSRTTTARLLELAAQSRTAFDEMMAELRPACDFSATGKLVLYRNRAAVEAARDQIELQAELGGAWQRLVTPDQCIAIEPALSNYRSQFAGAVHTPSECVADCGQLCLALWTALAQRGVEFHLGREIQGFERADGDRVAVRTDAGPCAADAYVLALGSASAAVARRVGVALPVYPLKGYSITIELGKAVAEAPRVSVTDSARKVVFARLGSRLRVAGMAELVGFDGRIPADRIETLKSAVRALFPQLGGLDDPRPWTGMRPATPTGRPIVGRLPGAPSNLLFNTGHGALGFTLAFGSAASIAHALAA